MSETEAVEFTVDKVRIYGPKVDGGWTVTFEVGEYEKQNLAKLISLSPDKVLKVRVEEEHE